MHANKTNQCGSSFRLLVNATTMNSVTIDSENSADNMRPSSEGTVVSKVN